MSYMYLSAYTIFMRLLSIRLISADSSDYTQRKYIVKDIHEGKCFTSGIKTDGGQLIAKQVFLICSESHCWLNFSDAGNSQFTLSMLNYHDIKGISKSCIRSTSFSEREVPEMFSLQSLFFYTVNEIRANRKFPDLINVRHGYIYELSRSARVEILLRRSTYKYTNMNWLLCIPFPRRALWLRA